MSNPGHETSSEPLHIWLHVRSALLCLIFVITLVLNILLILVLRKMKSRRSKADSASYIIEKSYMYLLFHLAFSDMLGVLLNIPFGILDFAGIAYNFHQVSCSILLPLQLASTTAQAGTYVALSYHRFRAIVYPIHANLTVFKSILMICLIWGVGFCLSLPYAIVIRHTDEGCTEVWPQGLLSSNVYTFAIFIVQYAGPVVMMAIFYVAIAKTLQEHRTGREIGNTRAQEDIRTHRHIVKMLVTIVTVYSVCMLPHHLIWIINGLRPMGTSTFNMVSQVSYLFTYSNTVANPAVFFLYNKESRNHVKQLFRKCCCYRPKLNVPFEIDVNMMWSGSSSGNSKSDNNNRFEKKSLRTDRVRLNQLFPTHPGDCDLGVSLPWEAQVLGASHDTIDDVEEEREYGECDPSVTPPAVKDIFFCRMEPAVEGTRCDEEPPKREKGSAEVTCGDNDTGLKMDGISERDEESMSEDETERVQNLIKEMVVDIKREMSDDESYDDGDILSSGDISHNEESGGDILKNEDALVGNGHIVNNYDQPGNGRIPRNAANKGDIMSNGSLARNGDILNNGGTHATNRYQFGDHSSYGDSGPESDKGSFSESENNKVSASHEDLVNDMINFLENSPHVRDIDELKEHLWNLPEDDV